jgi:hypothetical protein
MRRLGNILFWCGASVLLATYIIGAISAVSAAYGTSGLLGVAIALALVLALPAIIVGTILAE